MSIPRQAPHRDEGLTEAIRAAGGVGALAQKIGISQPSVSNWTRVPAERVVAVESITGVARTILRPDLYDSSSDVSDTIDAVDAARAREYAVLAAVLARAPSADLLAQLAGVRGDASVLGMAHIAVAEAASATTVERVEREFFNLFIGLGRGELMPYGSYYLTGFVYERPLARLREDLARIGIERAESNIEPEDHIATLCEIMSGVIDGRLSAPAGTDRKLFTTHLAPWAGRFFADLEHAQEANFYRRIGALGRVFMDIETEAFALPT